MSTQDVNARWRSTEASTPRPAWWTELAVAGFGVLLGLVIALFVLT